MSTDHGSEACLPDIGVWIRIGNNRGDLLRVVFRDLFLSRRQGQMCNNGASLRDCFVGV